MIEDNLYAYPYLLMLGYSKVGKTALILEIAKS